MDDLEDASAGAPVVVEGVKDVRALKRLGVEKNVISLGKGLSIVQFCEQLAREWDQVILMTDWDRKGGRIARVLKEAFEADGVKVNDRIRARLVTLAKKEVKDIEGLPTFLERLRREALLGS